MLMYILYTDCIEGKKLSQYYDLFYCYCYIAIKISNPGTHKWRIVKLFY